MRIKPSIGLFVFVALVTLSGLSAHAEETAEISSGIGVNFVGSLPQDMQHQWLLMSDAEKNFCLETLSKITTRHSQDEVISLLGKPHRNILGLKMNWWVELGEHKDRVGVYFSPRGTAAEVVLDGGQGRFYYRYRLK